MISWNSVLIIAAVASFWTARLEAGEPPAHRGLHAIWATSDLLDLPYITGGQVVVQWGDLEPVEGRYDFAPLEAALQGLGDRPATLQVLLRNGTMQNVKPLGVSVMAKSL